MARLGYLSLRITERRRGWLDQLQKQLALKGPDKPDYTGVIDFALASTVRNEDRDVEHWWHWAMRSEGGRKAIAEAGLRVDFAYPWRGIVGQDRRGYWRAQPWIDPSEKGTGHTWSIHVDELRKELGEDAGCFFVEHVSYLREQDAHYHNPSDHMTLVAVSANGKKSAWREVYARSAGA